MSTSKRRMGTFLIGVLVGVAFSLSVSVAMMDRIPDAVPKPAIEWQGTPLHLESDLGFA